MSTTKTYTIGFLFSILLTLAAYFSVTKHLFSTPTLIVAIIILALIQFLVQIVYFLRLGQEPLSQMNLVMLVSTISMILVVVIGSLWIMGHLNYNHSKTQQQLIQDEAIPLPPSK